MIYIIDKYLILFMKNIETQFIGGRNVGVRPTFIGEGEITKRLVRGTNSRKSPISGHPSTGKLFGISITPVDLFPPWPFRPWTIRYVFLETNTHTRVHVLHVHSEITRNVSITRTVDLLLYFGSVNEHAQPVFQPFFLPSAVTRIVCSKALYIAHR